MEKKRLEQLSGHSRYVAEKTLEIMDKAFDPSMNLLVRDQGDPKAPQGPARHDVRSSSYYAAGLLVRGRATDQERARAILEKVIDNQFNLPEEIYHGTYRRSPQDEPPPIGASSWRNWKEAPASLAPWGCYDPNWREFIGCTLAFILAHFENDLPASLVSKMDQSAKRAVEASIDRRLHPVIPMQTNIELMHVFLADFFGNRFQVSSWQNHAEREARRIHEAFVEHHSFSEYNSPTYYGIDLWALGFWRSYAHSPAIRALGAHMEAGIWEDIATLYHPSLKNLSGPFTRAYGMNMQEYVTPTGLYFWLELGGVQSPLPDPGQPRVDRGLPYPQVWDYCYGPMVAVMGTQIPDRVRTALTNDTGDRQVTKVFVEEGHLCTATATIRKTLMWGALSGSRSQSGQLHAATIYWKADELLFCLRVSRREPGQFWDKPMAGVIFDAQLIPDGVDIEITLDRTEDVEIFFEVRGEGLSAAQIRGPEWDLPGLRLAVTTDMKAPPRVDVFPHSMELSYHLTMPLNSGKGNSVRFTLQSEQLGARPSRSSPHGVP